MTMLDAHTEDVRADDLACVLNGFRDPSRIAIARHLAHGEQRVVDLTARLGLAQPTVSRHLACLRECGLATSRPEGRASWWSLTHPDEVGHLLAAAQALVDLTGGAVSRCATSGTDARLQGR